MNYANLLSFFRLFSLPAIILCLQQRHAFFLWMGFGLFLASCLSDYLDGYIARRFHQTSELGRFLDPLADKVLVLGLLGYFVFQKALWGWHLSMVFALILRDSLISWMRFKKKKGSQPLASSRLAKYKTAFQMTGLGIFLLETIFQNTLLNQIGLACLWITSIMAWITGYLYLQKQGICADRS